MAGVWHLRHAPGMRVAGSGLQNVMALGIATTERMWRIAACALAASLALGPQLAAGAGDAAPDLTALPLERLLDIEIEGASKFPQKLSDAPSAVTVITAEDIRTYGYRTLGDLLRSVRGLHVTDDRNYQYLGARGFGRPGDYNTRLLLLVDGYRLNDNVYDGALIDRSFPISLDLIERVEFVPGPGSAVYGSNAVLGVINVVTRRARDLEGVQVSGEAGSAGARGARAGYGRRGEGGGELLLSASRYRSAGRDLYYPEFDTPATNNGIAAGLDHEERRDVFFKGTAGPWSVSAAHAERTKGIPTASYSQVFNDPRSRTVDAQSFVNVQLEQALGGARRVLARMFAGRYDYRGDYVYDLPPVTLNRDLSYGRWWGSEVKLVQQFPGGHTLAAGGEAQRDQRRDQLNYDVDPYTAYLDDRRKGRRWAAYLQGEARLGEALGANLGLRRDAVEGAEGTTSPRLALVWRIEPQTTLKAIGGAAYRTPNAYERYYAIAPTNKTNPDLKGERMRTRELVLERYFGPRARLSGSVYAYRMHNLIQIVLDPADGQLVFRNVERVEARGAEIEGEWRGRELRMRASYAHQDVREAGTGSEPTNAPLHLAKLNVSLPLGDPRVRAGIEGQGMSRRKTLAGEVGGHAIVNLTLLHGALAKNLDATLGIYNLLDRVYADPGSAEHRQDAIAQDGRSVRFKLDYRF